MVAALKTVAVLVVARDIRHCSACEARVIAGDIPLLARKPSNPHPGTRPARPRSPARRTERRSVRARRSGTSYAAYMLEAATARLDLAVLCFDPRGKELDVGAPLFDLEREDVAPGPVQVISQVKDLLPEAIASG